MSVLKLTSRRRLEDIDKPALLSLSLSAPSFLATDLRDDLASPLYSTTTANTTTSIHRATPSPAKTADIRWPTTADPRPKGKKAPDGVLLQLPGAAWIPANSFLKPSTSMDRPRKFRIPHYSHNMKWQKRSSGYWCTTSTVKGPIATYDPPTDDLPGRLTVYETLQDEHDVGPMLVHRGVSILLLDYLLISCILLVTDSQEYLALSSGPGNLSTNTDLVWKNIARGPSLFRNTPPVTTQDGTPDNELATTPSREQVEEIMHKDPCYLRSQQQASTSRLSFSSQSDNGHEIDSGLDASPPPRSWAARADSLVDPLSNLSAPHTYIDPSFYADGSTPPVPALPLHFTNQIRESVPATSSTCEFPISKGSHSRPDSGSSIAGPSSDGCLWQRRSSETSISRSISRPLPRAPATSSSRVEPHGPAVRRSHSHTRFGAEKSWSSADVPPLPSPQSMAMVLPTRSPRTPSQGRSLPPTPYDLATNRAPSSLRIPTGVMTTGVDGYRGAHLVRKNFGSNYEHRGRSSDSPLGWTQTNQEEPSPTRPSFDCPPPAYTAIDFNAPNPGWIPDS